MRDLLGLMGDSADNIPGIKGVGENCLDSNDILFNKEFISYF